MLLLNHRNPCWGGNSYKRSDSVSGKKSFLTTEPAIWETQPQGEASLALVGPGAQVDKDPGEGSGNLLLLPRG